MEIPHRIRALVGVRATVAGLLAALLAGWALSAPFQVQIGEKHLDGLEWTAAAPASVPEGAAAGPTAPTPATPPAHATSSDRGPAAGPTDPLPFRLVDMGGVGIPADSAAWGTTYSHATHAFDPLILDTEPWIDPVGAARIREDWRRYLGRMAALGSTAVVLDLFLELVDFRGVGSGADVYPPGHPLRPRHRAFRGLARELTAEAAKLGMEVYLKTDLPAVTPPLRRYLAKLPGGDDPSTTGFWAPYAAAFDEVFTTVPGVAGVVIRVGEAGPLYNVPGLDYSSYMGVREPAELQQMLRTLLPVFEARGRTLIFRSWSVGVGPLGDLHNDPEVYRAVLGPIRSPALVVSTKFVQGDYFGFLPLNPTLLTGEHRRLIEFQARREYEGFGALPNYLAHAHGEALRQVRAANPRVMGTSLWTQEGGPLRAGPLSLYDVTGFWRWTDANVYATTRLALDPSADPRRLAEEWARDTFGAEPVAASTLADLLLASREAVEKGFYIRPYARRRMAVVGVDAPPLLWVFEWDVIGGWSAVLASLYRSLDGDIETSIAEGWEAVALTRTMRDRLDALQGPLGDHPDYPLMRASLDYQSSLFTALADFRESFLRYYAWLDGGGDPGSWRESALRFETSARAHLAAYEGDLDFPAFDFTPALTAMEAARDEAGRTVAARALAALLLIGLLLGTDWARDRTPDHPGKESARWLRLAAWEPVRLSPVDGSRDVGPARTMVLLWAAGLASVGLVLPGATGLLPGVTAIGLAYVSGLASSWTSSSSRASDGRGSAPVVRAPWASAWAMTGPLVWPTLAVLLVTAVRGPGYLWFLFWTHAPFRTLLFALAAGVGGGILLSSLRAGLRVPGGGWRFAGGSVVVATGAALLALGLVLPDLAGVLGALDEPLRLLPMRRAIVNGITHYAGFDAVPGHLPELIGGTLVALGFLIRGRRSGSQGRAVAAPGSSGARVSGA